VATELLSVRRFRPGAESVDVIATTLLGQGFALLARST
jgi:hypothetical protein